jgi:hypothetical protein
MVAVAVEVVVTFLQPLEVLVVVVALFLREIRQLIRQEGQHKALLVKAIKAE